MFWWNSPRVCSQRPSMKSPNSARARPAALGGTLVIGDRLQLWAGLGSRSTPGVPGLVPVNAGAVAGVNVQRPQRASARTNDVEAGKARRRVLAGRDLVVPLPAQRRG